MIITRFAPSPTGLLHIGSARTALFCWLWAKNQQGKFILRIEDTDLERSTPEAVQVILEGLQWLGLTWDEGPIFQTQRFDRYRAVIDQLLAQNAAYRCYCTKERLDALREQQMAAKEKPRYDGHCRDRTDHPDAPYVVRFKTPHTGTLVFHDLIRGNIETQNSELDDLVILRSNGAPTYNFTVVVDDWDMGITHVLRGDDHINNTPRQIHIFQALGAPIPLYGHMPMLLGPDGKKLSKRLGAASVLAYREEGILPEALLNYLVRLGWSHGDQEIFSIEEMKALFDIQAIQVSPSAMNPEKLMWLNQHYLKNLLPEQVATQLAWHMEREGIAYQNGPSLEKIVIAQRERCKTLVEMVEKSRFFYLESIVIEPALKEKYFTDPIIITALNYLMDELEKLSNWTQEALHEVMNRVVEQQGIKLGALAPCVRLALTGGMVSPSIDATLFVMGKEKTLERLKAIDSGSKGS